MTASADNTRMCGLLSAVWPRNTAKLAARAAGVSARTAEAWTTGRRSPAADTLLRMAERNDAFRDALVARLVSARADRAADAERKAAAVGSAPAVKGGQE